MQTPIIIVLETWNVIICERLCFCVFLCMGVKLGYLYAWRTKGRSVLRTACWWVCQGLKGVGDAFNRRVEKIAWWEISWFLLHAGYLLFGSWNEVICDRLVMWHALREKRNLYGVLVRKPNIKRRPFGKPRRTWENNIRLILKWALKEFDRTVWNGFMWLRTGPSDGLLWEWNWTLGFCKMLWAFWQTEELLDFQEVLSFVFIRKTRSGTSKIHRL